MKIRGTVHIATHHDVVACTEVGGGPAENIGFDAQLARHHGPSASGRFNRSCRNFFAFKAAEIIGDAPVFAADNHKRCAVVVLVNSLYQRCAGVLRIEFNQRADVAQAHLVNTTGNAGDGRDGPRAHINRDIQALVFVVALALRQEKRRRLPGDAKVKREFDRCESSAGLRPDRWRRQGRGGAQGGDEVATFHGNHVFISGEALEYISHTLCAQPDGSRAISGCYMQVHGH